MIALLTGFVPLPPSANKLHGIDSRPRTTRTGKIRKATVYTLPEVTQWKRDAVLCLHAAYQDIAHIETCRHNDVPLYLSLLAYLPAKRLTVRDDDNFIKVARDLVLNTYLAIDDVRVYDTHVSKRLCPPDTEPSLLVSVYQMEDLYHVEGFYLPRKEGTSNGPMANKTRQASPRAS